MNHQIMQSQGFTSIRPAVHEWGVQAPVSSHSFAEDLILNGPRARLASSEVTASLKWLARAVEGQELKACGSPCFARP